MSLQGGRLQRLDACSAAELDGSAVGRHTRFGKPGRPRREGGVAAICTSFAGLQIAPAAGAPLASTCRAERSHGRCQTAGVSSPEVRPLSRSVRQPSVIRREDLHGIPARLLTAVTWSLAGDSALSTVGNTSPRQRYRALCLRTDDPGARLAHRRCDPPVEPLYAPPHGWGVGMFGPSLAVLVVPSPVQLDEGEHIPMQRRRNGDCSWPVERSRAGTLVLMAALRRRALGTG